MYNDDEELFRITERERQKHFALLDFADAVERNTFLEMMTLLHEELIKRGYTDRIAR